MKKKISLTGVKPTGMPHIGNYFGAISPALRLAEKYEARYFIADYHALNSIKDPRVLEDLTYEVAAAWLSCGLDPETMLFYKQSSVPETFELATILTAFTPKGLMNRAHAYKAVSADNVQRGKDPDDGINMGLFTYPVLMAADILLFDPDIVPVGKDQQQHLEMTVDIAQALNFNYKQDVFNIPRGISDENTKTVTGLDGRKMSKSYNNAIPLFLEQKKLRKLIMRIVTTSQSVEEPKDPEGCTIFSLYKLFADENRRGTIKEKYLAGGMGWGTAKQELFEVMDLELAPMRDKYNKLINDRAYIDELLKKGALSAREIAAGKIDSLRRIIGIE